MMKSVLIVCLFAMSILARSSAVAADNTSLTFYPVADNYVGSKYPKLGHYGTSSVLYVGNSYDHAQNIWGSERIYIQFDLTGISKNRVIARATLSLWQFYAPGSNQTYETHRVLAGWNETTQNWDTQPSWAPETTSKATAPNRNEVLVQWDITADVKAWHSGQAPNYGTMIKVTEERRVQDASSGFWSWPPQLCRPSDGANTFTAANQERK